MKLSEHQLNYYEVKCFDIIATSGNRSTALTRLLNFRYKGFKLPKKGCEELINIYIKDYGSISTRNYVKTKSKSKYKKKTKS